MLWIQVVYNLLLNGIHPRHMNCKNKTTIKELVKILIYWYSSIIKSEMPSKKKTIKYSPQGDRIHWITQSNTLSTRKINVPSEPRNHRVSSLLLNDWLIWIFVEKIRWISENNVFHTKKSFCAKKKSFFELFHCVSFQKINVFFFGLID